MSNHSSSGGRRPPRRGTVSAFTEPEVRRWPHPVDGVSAQERRAPGSAWRESAPVSGWSQSTEPALYYIHCALSYQNQLLADIKALLEQLAEDRAAPQEKP